MRSYPVIYFFIITNVLTFGNRTRADERYEFQIEPIRALWKANNPSSDVFAAAESKLPTSEEELRELCVAARDYARLDLRNLKDVVPVRQDPVKIVYSNKDESTDYIDLLWCGTIPEIWIQAGESANEFVILMYNSEYISPDPDRYFFSVTTTDHEPVARTYSSSEYEQSIKDDPLEKVSGGDALLHICWNAKRHVDVAIAKPVLQSTEVYYGRLFEFKFERDKKTEYFAIECPSLPVMYVYFDHSPNLIKIVLVKTEEKTLNESIETKPLASGVGRALKRKSPDAGVSLHT